MDNKAKLILISMIIISTLGIGAFLLKRENSEPNDIDENRIAVTIFPVYDIARNIGGDKVEVIQILPNGASPHTFEPTAKDIEEVKKSAAVFKIGDGLDDWADDMLGDGSKVVDISANSPTPFTKGSYEFLAELEDDEYEDEGHEDEEHEDEEHEGGEHEDEEHEDEDHHDHGSTDPHYWMSPDNAVIIAEMIKDELQVLDPDNANYYEENFAEYSSKLSSLKDYANSKLDKFEDRGIITYHGAFYYLADFADFEIINTIEPIAGRESTAEHLDEVNEDIEHYNLKVLYKEPQLSDKLLESFVDENGVEIMVLDALGGVKGRDSYIDLIKFNIDQVEKGLTL